MELGRCQRWSLLEWARLNPDQVRGFFVRMRTRWTVDVPVLSGWKSRGGRKRTRSPSRSRPGVEKKKNRSRSTAGVANGPPGVEASVQSSSQPDPGPPGAWNGFVGQDNGPHQEGEREDVVLLDEDELEEEQSVLDPGPSNLVDLRPKMKPGKKRLSSVRKVSKKERVLTYDEVIEGPGRVEAAYDDLDFEFKIPREVEEFEI